MNIGLVIAMKMEAPNIFHNGSGIYQIGDHTVHTIISGIRQPKARCAAEQICREFQPDCLMMLGVCGGTSDSEEVGHIIVADSVIYENEVIELDNQYTKKAIDDLQGMAYHKGTFQTSNWPVLSRKRVIENIIAVDMESFAMADIGRTYNIPAVVFKSVCDMVPLRIGKGTLMNLINYRRDIAKAKVQLNAFTERYFA